MERRPTIHDVARHAGVGVKTVSRVLNGERAVSEATRARVRASIRALDYRPNAAARVLRRRLDRSIGLICEDIAEPVQAQLARAVEGVASDHGAVLTVSLTHHDPAREQAVITSLLSRQVDGLILWPTGTGSGFLRRVAETVPMVCVDRPIPGVATDTVLTDNRGAVESAVGLLHRRGHRRIAFVGDDPDLFTQAERFDGYRSGLAARGVATDPGIVFRRQQRVTQLRRQLAYWRAAPVPPSAIIAASSVAANALVRAMDGDDPVSVLAFDDFPLADVVRGGIPVISQDVDAIGRTAAERLFARLSGDRHDPSWTRIAATLIERAPDSDRGRDRALGSGQPTPPGAGRPSRAP